MESGSARADGPEAYPSIPGYEILGVLGRGGMGIVYRARQTELKRPVALKMLIAGALASPEAAARFRVEVEAMARLRHPNIVQIYGVGQHAGRRSWCSSWSRAARWPRSWPARRSRPSGRRGRWRRWRGPSTRRTCLGVVHRDLSPANILVADDGTPKVTDFGLAKLLIGDGSLRTQTGDLLGTPSYMSPEQAAGSHRSVGGATDVYALGAILYEMLTGRPPFKAEEPLETLRQVVQRGAGDTVAVAAPTAARPRDDLPEVPGEGAGKAL